MSRNCLIIAAYTIGDPTTKNTANSLAEAGWKVTVIQEIPTNFNQPSIPSGIEVITLPAFASGLIPKFLKSLLRWLVLLGSVHWILFFRDFELVITFMHRPLAALPQLKKKRFYLISCIYDIPQLIELGKLNRWVIAQGWKRLQWADLVWASDVYRAQLTQQFAQLPQLPMVCHNCPPLSYGEHPVTLEDKQWLRKELQAQGVNVPTKGGSILIRAGAIGDHCGIEDTLLAMKYLPSDYVFLLMGRPSASYAQKMMTMVKDLGLGGRVVFWDRPSDEVWKKALFGADIGHLVHLYPQVKVHQQIYDFNSSLSNYRLFNYFAMGLPIICHHDKRMEAIRHEVPCFRVAHQENLVQEIQQAWSAFATQPDHVEAMGQLASQAFRSTYNWEAQFAPILAKISALG